MIAAVVTLHQRLGPDQFDADIQAFGKAEIGMAHTGISQIHRIGLPEDDLCEAFGDFHLEGGFVVLDDLTNNGPADPAVLIPKRTGEVFHRINPRGQSFPESHVFSIARLFQQFQESLFSDILFQVLEDPDVFVMAMLCPLQES